MPILSIFIKYIILYLRRKAGLYPAIYSNTYYYKYIIFILILHYLINFGSATYFMKYLYKYNMYDIYYKLCFVKNSTTLYPSIL